MEVSEDGAEGLLWSGSLKSRLDFALEQNFPNPFNPSTTIAFSIAEPGRVRLGIYDVAGRLVRTLVDERTSADHYIVEWDGYDNRGARVSSGVYFYRIVAGKHTQTRKMVLVE